MILLSALVIGWWFGWQWPWWLWMLAAWQAYRAMGRVEA